MATETETRILGPDGRPFVRPPTKLQAPAQEIGGARSVVSGVDMDSLSPRLIKTMLQDAESGDLASQAALFERMEEKDGELDAHLRTRKSAVASLPYEIEPGDDSPQAANAAEFAREAVEGIPALHDALVDLLDAVPKGLAALEIDWETAKDSWRVAGLVYNSQRFFETAADGQAIKLKTAWGESEDLKPNKWIVHRAKARSGYAGRTSLLRSCVRAFIVRHISWKDWMAFAEVYGMPARLGRLREGVPWDSAEARQLWAAVRALGMDAAAVVRAGDSIEILGSPATGEGGIFQAIIDRAAHEMTLAILGQTLTSGGEKGGSYALGQVHNLVRQDLRDADALALGQTLSDQLLAPLVLLNLGQVPLPRWVFIPDDPVDLAQLATTVKTLGEASPHLPVPKSWLYNRFGIPEPTEDEETVELGQAMGMGMGMMESRAPRARRRARAPTADPMLRYTARLWRCSPEQLCLRLNQADVGWRVMDKTALSFLAEKRIASDAAWQALGPAGRQRAWRVSGLGEQPTALVANEMTQVLEAGETENQFLERLEDLGLSVPDEVEAVAGQLPAWQARLVHRNNRWGAQNAGQYIRLQQDRDVRPYGQWMCHSPCDICAPLCGNVAPLDSEFFSTFWPQIHHGCQCEVVSLGADDLESEGLRESLEQTDPSPLDADPGFLFQPGDAYYLEAEGGAPVSDAGRRDADLLSTLSTIGAFL